MPKKRLFLVGEGFPILINSDNGQSIELHSRYISTKSIAFDVAISKNLNLKKKDHKHRVKLWIEEVE
jgi:hypothetical protein